MPYSMCGTNTVYCFLCQGNSLNPLFKIEADDGIDSVCKGTHERFVIYLEKFNKKAEKNEYSENE